LRVPSGEPEETQTLVYALVDPDGCEVRYVGLSLSGLRRPAQHGKPGHVLAERNEAKRAWLLDLLRRGTSYRVAILVWGVRPEVIGDVERACIAYYRRTGARLVNGNRGGAGRASRMTELERYDLRAEAARQSEADARLVDWMMTGSNFQRWFDGELGIPQRVIGY
jgi:hypothetical protein